MQVWMEEGVYLQRFRDLPGKRRSVKWGASSNIALQLQVRQEEPKPNHSAEASSVDTGESLLDIYSSKGGKGENTLRKTPPLNPNNQEPGQRTERKEPGRKQLVKWPKANEVAVWQQLNEELSFILEQSLCGKVEGEEGEREIEKQPLEAKAHLQTQKAEGEEQLL